MDALEPMTVEVTADTIEDHPQVICFINQKNEYYHLKVEWLQEQFGKSPLPSINNWQEELAGYKGLSIVYSRQCPWVARFIEEVKPIIDEKKLDISITELTTPEQAQHAPSLYSVFNLIYNGRLLADRYISATRFRNIIEKELKC